MIHVTKTFLPPLEEYEFYLQRIWSSNQVANGGELWFELQSKLKNYLGVPNVLLTANGTLALQIAIKNLAQRGEVITTPFSYVATTSALVWENCTPVFVDIHPEFLTIDESKIEAAITEKTTAILATHVFGNPCNVEEIQRIASKYNLKVIYDAAHCFGVQYKGESIFNYGDVSICSFHATKLFHTGEGGAIFCRDEELYQKLFCSHNFGHIATSDFAGVGINAKMNELQAAMGLAVLPHVDEIIFERKRLVNVYVNQLSETDLDFITLREETDWNYSYLPVMFRDETQLLNVQRRLNKENIFPRRYFYPSLNKLNYVSSLEMKVSEDISRRILCLPLYRDLGRDAIRDITDVLKK